jgi:hypothetical protein
MHATNEIPSGPEFASPAEFSAFAEEFTRRLHAAPAVDASHRALSARDVAQVRNARRNLNLDMIRLMERGARSDSPEVSAIRAKLAALPDPNA